MLYESQYLIHWPTCTLNRDTISGVMMYRTMRNSDGMRMFLNEMPDLGPLNNINNMKFMELYMVTL